MRLSRILGLAVLPALCALTSAQTPVELIGLVDRTPAPVVRLNPNTATCVTSACSTLLTSVSAPILGGSAYDATRSAVWVSNGPLIEAVDPNTCQVICPPQTLPAMVTNTRITGLAINEDKNVLVVTDTANGISIYRLSCPVQTRVLRCTPVLPVGHQIGGVATDDVNDLVIWSSSNLGGINPNNTVYIAPRSNPCQPVCTIQVPQCGGQRLGPITGVGYDPCKRTIWVTDGVLVAGLQRSNLSLCTVTVVSCCPMNIGNGYVGLCVKPSEATSSGNSCTNLGCPNCPNLVHSITGDAAIGNPAFSLNLENAPANSIATLFVGAGPCDPGGPVVAPFCGPFQVLLVPPPLAISFNTGGGGGGGPCNGGVRVPLPIPADPSLCGAVLASQWFGVCTQGPLIGTYVSNCQTWMVTGS